MARAPDIIITNASVLTMDTTRPRAEAVAIARNRIVAVGTSGEIGALKGRHTQVIEAARATVMPGFNEGHMHLFPGATELDHLSLGRRARVRCPWQRGPRRSLRPATRR